MTHLTFYLIRHGQTQLNAERKLQGVMDSALTEKGKRQAAKAGQLIANVKFLKAYSSDSGRVKQTGEIIRKYNRQKFDVTYRSGLREFYFGNLEGSSALKAYWTVIKQHGLRQTYRMHQEPDFLVTLLNNLYNLDQTRQAEDFELLKQRVTEQMKKIILEMADHEGNVLILAHALVLSMLIYLVDATALPKGFLKNGSVSILDYQDGNWSVKSVNIADAKELKID
ncbi:histidine phosphatase family protein [Holzapfeliella floricola]|uniref:Phosphoglycerate mutase n=1 Tax=Holzapfeliella floricola DSM 23037 = JCM 16512 TaxID=1423744 RepID=A0A0R2DHH3_9LACO|nr:histidine phosphatase family protein [Holzapfeliella floricola]KRN03551.1 phosphoglycerate mutase [Holzapfeliella floricola DSM 23037 = JCM 16512]